MLLHMTKNVILTFGYHDRESPRHRNICKAYAQEGFSITECHTQKNGLVPKLKELGEQVKKHHTNACALLVPFPGHHLTPFAWFIAKRYRLKLIVDMFFSLHEITIEDRRRHSRWHPQAFFLWILDFLCSHLPDEVIIDTEAHKKFLVDRFKANPKKVRVIYVGTREDLFRPKPLKDHPQSIFEVLFYGTYIPHQGIEYIVQAAKTLESSHSNIHFTFIGKGQTYPAIQRIVQELNLTNITFKPFLPLEQLAQHVRGADMCLGVFGTAPKVQNVISHKIFDAVACNVPILTAQSHAIREKFSEKDGVYFCRAGNPEAIADGIIKIYTAHHAQS